MAPFKRFTKRLLMQNNQNRTSLAASHMCWYFTHAVLTTALSLARSSTSSCSSALWCHRSDRGSSIMVNRQTMPTDTVVQPRMIMHLFKWETLHRMSLCWGVGKENKCLNLPHPSVHVAHRRYVRDAIMDEATESDGKAIAKPECTKSQRLLRSSVERADK